MTEKNQSKIKIEDLPEAEKELTAEEAKNLIGGWNFPTTKCAYVNPDAVAVDDLTSKAGDGSVKPQNITSPRDPATGLCSSKRK